MKTIRKDLLAMFIEVSRNYWKTGNTDLLEERKDIVFEIERTSKIHWLWINDFIDSLIGSRSALFPQASNDDIYNILNFIGWEVVDGE